MPRSRRAPPGAMNSKFLFKMCGSSFWGEPPSPHHEATKRATSTGQAPRPRQPTAQTVLAATLRPATTLPQFNQTDRRLQRIKKLIDFELDFNAIWIPIWAHLDTRTRVILASKIVYRPPQTHPKTRLGTRIQQEPLQVSTIMDLGWIFGSFQLI